MKINNLFAFLRYFIIILILVLTILPLAWIILTGFKNELEYLHTPPIWFPSDPSFDNYIEMWLDGGKDAFINSLFITTTSTILAILLGVPGAYSLSRFNTGGDNFAYWILSIKFLPPIAFAIPISIMFSNFNLIDTYTGLILVYTTFNLPFVIWILRGFINEIPKEIDDAAMIDGCGKFQIIYKITVPLLGPGLVTVTILTFIFIWSEFLFALILNNSELYTVPVRLSMYFSEAVGLKWGPQSDLATISIIPMILMAFIGQNYIVRALTFGAVK
mgnify:CR=1 FL=1